MSHLRPFKTAKEEVKKSSSCNTTLSLFLLDFFHFFGFIHDYCNVGLAVYGIDPNSPLSIFFNKQDLGLFDPKASNILCVLDPLDKSNNVTRGCSKISLIAAHFASAYKSLTFRTDQFKLLTPKDDRSLIKGFLSRVLFIVG